MVCMNDQSLLVSDDLQKVHPIMYHSCLNCCSFGTIRCGSSASAEHVRYSIAAWQTVPTSGVHSNRLHADSRTIAALLCSRPACSDAVKGRLNATVPCGTYLQLHRPWFSLKSRSSCKRRLMPLTGRSCCEGIGQSYTETSTCMLKSSKPTSWLYTVVHNAEVCASERCPLGHVVTFTTLKSRRSGALR